MKPLKTALAVLLALALLATYQDCAGLQFVEQEASETANAYSAVSADQSLRLEMNAVAIGRSDLVKENEFYIRVEMRSEG